MPKKKKAGRPRIYSGGAITKSFVIPSELAERIETLAKKWGLSFSGCCVQLLKFAESKKAGNANPPK